MGSKAINKKYTIHSLKDDAGDFYFAVYEENTEQVIAFHYFQEDAKKQAKFMESGGSFDGFTPSFVLRQIPSQVIDPNDKFQSLTNNAK